MLGKITRPPVISGDRSGFPDGLSSPKSPLDFKIRSPRGMKNCDVGGVGLAIVAALEKSCTGVAAGVPVKLIVGNLNFNRSEPIPICTSSAAKSSSNKCGRVVAEECSDEMDYGESYTYVTCHRPNKESFTRVYCDDGGDDQDCDDQGRNFDNSRLKNLGVFYESPPPRMTAAAPVFPTSDFLSSCHMCRKKLHGKDIYMYRGEKAFCSTECRHKQIVKDERKEKCRTEFSRYGEVSVSPYSGGQLFSTGIFAT